jgi:Na+/melibiose symporter-like transporter
MNLAISVCNVYTFEYFADYVGIRLNYLNIAFVLMLSILLLALPITGYLADITNSRWGRRRPWIIIGAPVFFLSVLLLFLAPTRPPLLQSLMDEETWGALYFGVTYCMASLSNFVLQTPYYAFGVELTHDFDQRSSLFGYAQAFNVIGLVLAMGAPEFLMGWFPNARSVFLVINSLTAVAGLCCFGLMILVLRERIEHQPKPVMDLVPGLRFCLLDNRPFLALFIVITLQTAAPHTPTLLPFWVKYTLELDDFYGSILMTLLIVCALLFIPFWNKVAHLWGKRKAYIIALMSGFISWSLMALPHRDQLGEAIITTALCGMSGIFLTNSNFLYEVGNVT